jgi:hypothetical protein
MSSTNLAPLAAREQRVVDALSRVFPAGLGTVAGAAGLGGLGRALVSAYCSSPTDPSVGAGGSYCASVAHGVSRVLYIAVAVSISMVVITLRRRLRHRHAIALIAVLLALIANTIVVFSLPNLAG